MKEIKLTRGLIAIIDEEDYAAISNLKWFACPSQTGAFYAVRSSHIGRKNFRVSMHSVINGTPFGMCTDHINGNTLDNRRANLRTCTKAENNRNRGACKGKHLGLKGTYFHKKRRKWHASIQVNGVSRHIGVFVNPYDAARAYDKAASELHGHFAKLNFPLAQ